jgi:hypothetical protein
MEGTTLRTPTKLAAITAAIAVTVPVGIAQATHDEGQAGAPGQVCKELRQDNKSELRAFRSQNPRPSNAAIKAMRKSQHAEYKECIKEAAEARTEDQ